MAKKHYLPEEVVGELGQAEVLHGQGLAMAEAIRKLRIARSVYGARSVAG